MRQAKMLWRMVSRAFLPHSRGLIAALRRLTLCSSFVENDLMKIKSKHAVRKAPAKINLSLHILGRLTSGYHLLSSLFCPISLSDTLKISLIDRNEAGANTVSVRLGTELARHVAALERVEPGTREIVVGLQSNENIACRAAELFFGALLDDHSARNLGWIIEIEKNIPFAAGLGGGSGNAAATLLALNDLLDAPLSQAKLFELAARIGSDVPALLHGELCLMCGTGDMLIPIRGELGAFSKPTNLLLLKPPVSVSTAFAYEKLSFPKRIEPEKAQQHVWNSLKNEPRFKPLGLQLEGTLEGDKWLTLLPQEGIRLTLNRGLEDVICTHFVNDFQKSVTEGFPQVAEASNWLRECGAFHVLLCGSGSSFVGFFAEQDARDSALHKLKDLASNGWWCAAADLAPGKSLTEQ